jgi:NDP-sugar pyrophosphorylase family protein
MRYIDYGLGVFDRRVLDTVSDTGACDLASVQQDLLRRGELCGFEVSERFYEIGSVTGLEETARHLNHLISERRRAPKGKS